MNGSSRSGQDQVFAFLAGPATHGQSGPVVRIDTHGAAVFLAGGDAYKVKKAVRFPFMDFSTLEKRRLACERELAVNKAYAPALYLGVVPISQDGSSLRLGAAPGAKIIEWAVHMRRFDEERTLDRLAARSELDLETIAKLAAVVVDSHKRAESITWAKASAALREQLEETLSELAAAPAIFAPDIAMGLCAAMRESFARLEPILLERERGGEVRRCHGDLHLRNIALVGGDPVLFDAIEFDDKIATCDVLYDLAFLLMDLWIRGLRRHANLLFNRYLWACADSQRNLKGLALLPLFLSLRAAIRAKVIALEPGGELKRAAEARRHFEAALAFLAPSNLILAALGGLSGTGKSTLAAAIAPSVGRPPGAVHLRSDIERKRLFGAGEFEQLPQEAYRPETSPAIYGRLRAMAAIALEAGQSTILDAVHLRPEERRAAQEIAKEKGARFTGLWLKAPTEILLKRVAARERDASDANAEVVTAQARCVIAQHEWITLDATAPAGALEAQAIALISRR